jgi:hypothetical protein
MIFAGWLFQFIALIVVLTRMNSPMFQNVGWYWFHIQLYLLPVAPLLALALKGIPRVQVFTAAIILHALIAFTAYG